MSTAIDANVIIAWQTPSHAFHVQATELIGQATAPLWAGELTLAEVLVGLDQDAWPTLRETLDAMRIRRLSPPADLIALARREHGLRMPDAYALATAQAAQANALLTFDSAISRAAQKAGLETNPIPA